MPRLTPEQFARVRERRGFALLRPVEQWEEIFAGMTADEAAARLLSDLHCYTSERRKGIAWELRDGVLGDVAQVANALAAFPRSKVKADAAG